MILHMIALRFGMQGRDIFERTNASVMGLYFSMQEGDILEHTNGKCQLHAIFST